MNSQHSNNFRFAKPVFSFLITFFFTAALFAQVDPTFTTAVSYDSTASYPSGITIQPDGKILVYGNFQNVGGTPKSKIARLNSDGTLDASFNCICNDFTNIGSAVVQPNGKIIIAGTVGPAPNARIARLNADGSVDPTLTSPFNQGFGGATVWALAPDGKIYVTQSFAGFHISYVALSRLNTDGTFDSSFTQIGFDYWGNRDALYALQVLPDGKLLLGGKQTANGFGYLFRVNTNGSKDLTFESPVLTFNNQQFPWAYVYDFGIQSTGKIVITGNFDTVNGVSRQGFARLNTDMSVDMSFAPPVSGSSLEIVSGDKILINGFQRLHPDGTVDNTYNPAYNNYGIWKLDALERVVIAGTFTEGSAMSRRIARMNSDGSADNTFTNSYIGLSGEVMRLALQPDGKILINGNFNRINGNLTSTLARVNTNGTLDSSFDPGTGVDQSTVNSMVVQPDGKILLGGFFALYNGVPQQGIARVNSDGSLDAAFNPVLPSGGTVYDIKLQSDGKILIGGVFSSVNGTGRTSLARLNADGTLDNTFNPTIGSANIFSLFIQSNGQIMIGGTFTGVNGFNRTNFARLNSDGTLDTSFNAGSVFTIRQIAQQPDGKYLVLTNHPSNGSGSIARRNEDGTADAGFPMPTVINGGSNGFIKEFILQANGYIVVIGSFTNIANTPRNHIARLRPDAVVDTGFYPIGTDNYNNDIIQQADGKFVVGGNFTAVENIARNGIVRLGIPAAQPRTQFDFDGDGKADVAVFRPSENKWYILRSSDLGVTQQVWGIAGDVPVPADYDGDGKTDFAIYRASSGDWWSLSSINGAQVYAHWGASGDVPRPSDFDGDGRADYIVYRPSNFYWYRISSANGASSVQQFGLAGDKPVLGDFDGDGKSDKAIFRPSSGDWWYQSSINGAQLAVHWGVSTDVPAPADFDGDGKTDFCVYRPSTGTWYIINSNNGSFTIMNFGISEDKPVPADYDGDGKADIAVFRPSSGGWYLQRSAAGFWALNWGISTDIPVENAFVP